MSVQHPHSLFAAFLALCRERGVPIDEARFTEAHAILCDRPRWRYICPPGLRERYTETDPEDFLLDLLLCRMGHLDLASFGTNEAKMRVFSSLRSIAENESIVAAALQSVAQSQGLPPEQVETLCRAIADPNGWTAKDRKARLALNLQGNLTLPGTSAPLDLVHTGQCYDALDHELHLRGYQRDHLSTLDLLCQRLCHQTLRWSQAARNSGLARCFHDLFNPLRITKTEACTQFVHKMAIGTRTRLDLYDKNLCWALEPEPTYSQIPCFATPDRARWEQNPDVEVTDAVKGCATFRFANFHARNEKVEPLLDVAIDFLRDQEFCYTSALQRHLRIGFNAASELVEHLEARGLIARQSPDGPYNVLHVNFPE